MQNILAKSIATQESLQKELGHYDIPIENVAALSRIKKAYLEASQHLKTDQDVIDCKTHLYGSMQQMKRLGIDLNDIDLWFVNQYKGKIVAQYMYQALLVSAARRGYPCFAKFEFIRKGERFATHYAPNGRIVIQYTDVGMDKEVNLNNIQENFDFFFLLLDVRKDGRLIHQEKVIMSPAVILKHKAVSKAKEKGTVIKYKDANGWKEYTKDTESIWEQWTGPMIKKTLLLRAFSMTKHSLVGLEEVFEFEDLEEEVAMTKPTEDPIDLKAVQNDIYNPNEAVIKEIEKLKQEYIITPELIDWNKNNILSAINLCKNKAQVDMILSRESATILSIDGFLKEVENASKTIPAN